MIGSYAKRGIAAFHDADAARGEPNRAKRAGWHMNGCCVEAGDNIGQKRSAWVGTRFKFDGRNGATGEYHWALGSDFFSSFSTSSEM